MNRREFIQAASVFGFASAVFSGWSAEELTEAKKVFDLRSIRGPQDLKALPAGDIKSLCAALRKAILERVSKRTGHLGSNLGFVEGAVALHRVFDSPRDKIVYDISHQCYPHKMLTGRAEAFVDEAHFHDVTGYTNPTESDHDSFILGHTSMSVTLACGLAKARDLLGEKHNVIAVIGDGALTGGQAFEGLNNAALLKSNLIVILNDNGMSIAPNVGGLIGHYGDYLRAFGFDYRFVVDGNDEQAVEAALKAAKDADHPVAIHLKTVKGFGWGPSEKDPEHWHWGHAPFDPVTGESDNAAWGVLPISARFADHMLGKIAADPKVCVITPAVPASCGFVPEKRARAGRQFIDVGICEQHAVGFAAALAKGGAKPVLSVMSSYLQRAYDQLSQEVALNDQPMTLVVTDGTVTSLSDVTHYAAFDIPLLLPIPNLTYLCPTCEKEFFAMLDWSIEYREHPIAIRRPENGEIENDVPLLSSYASPVRYGVTRKGSKVAILALGGFYRLGAQVADALEKSGISATLISPRVANVLDERTLDSLTAAHKLVVTLEDGVIDGGFGEMVSRFYGLTPMRVLVRGASNAFVFHDNREKLMEQNRLTVPQLVGDILSAINGKS